MNSEQPQARPENLCGRCHMPIDDHIWFERAPFCRGAEPLPPPSGPYGPTRWVEDKLPSFMRNTK